MNMITTVEELYPYDTFVEDLSIVGYDNLLEPEIRTLRDKAYSIIRRFVGLSLEDLKDDEAIQAYKDTLFEIVRYTLVTSSEEEYKKYLSVALSTVMYLRIAKIDSAPSSFSNANYYANIC